MFDFKQVKYRKEKVVGKKYSCGFSDCIIYATFTSYLLQPNMIVITEYCYNLRSVYHIWLNT